MIIPWQLKVGAAVFAIVLVFGAGWKTRDAFCDAAAAREALAGERAISASLRGQLHAYQNATALDAQRALADQQEISRLEGVARDLENRIGDGACLDGGDVDQLRGLWTAPDR